MMQFRTLCPDIIEGFVAADLVARSFTAVQLSNFILKMLDDFVVELGVTNVLFRMSLKKQTLYNLYSSFLRKIPCHFKHFSNSD